MRLLANRIPPPLVMALIAGLMALVAPDPIGWPFFGLSAGYGLVVLLLVLTAFMVLALCVVGFVGAKTTVDPLHPELASQLVERGMYRFSRNPMYLAMALLLLAWAVCCRSLLAWLGPLCFVLYITRFQIIPEERALEKRFGASYRDYCSRVRRWL